MFKCKSQRSLITRINAPWKWHAPGITRAPRSPSGLAFLSNWPVHLVNSRRSQRSNLICARGRSDLGLNTHTWPCDTSSMNGLCILALSNELSNNSLIRHVELPAFTKCKVCSVSGYYKINSGRGLSKRPLCLLLRGISWVGTDWASCRYKNHVALFHLLPNATCDCSQISRLQCESSAWKHWQDKGLKYNSPSHFSKQGLPDIRLAG